MHNNRYTTNKALSPNATHIEKKTEDNKHKNQQKAKRERGFAKGGRYENANKHCGFVEA